MNLSSDIEFSPVVVALGFLCGVLLLQGLTLLWKSRQGPRTKRLAERLQILARTGDAAMATRLEKKSRLAALPGVDHVLRIFQRLFDMESWLLQSGQGWNSVQLLSRCLLCGLLPFVPLLLFTPLPLLAAACLSLSAAGLPVLYVRRQRRQRLARLALQLPQMLDYLVRDMRTGHALTNGLQSIAEKMPQPIAGEFRIVRDEIRLGVTLAQALANLTRRVPDADLNYFVIAVLINREMGGKLTEIFDNLSRLIRERQRFADKIRLLAAESQFTGWVLALLPFGLAALLNLINPEFMAPLRDDPVGVLIVKCGLILMVVGILVLRKIVRIRV